MVKTYEHLKNKCPDHLKERTRWHPSIWLFLVWQLIKTLLFHLHISHDVFGGAVGAYILRSIAIFPILSHTTTFKIHLLHQTRRMVWLTWWLYASKQIENCLKENLKKWKKKRTTHFIVITFSPLHRQTCVHITTAKL